MLEELEFVWAGPDELPAYEAFLDQAFGAGSVQSRPGRARWLYWDNPFGLHVALGLHAGRIVASCGHLPLPLQANNRNLLAGFGIDMMVLPDWRRQGVGRRFLEMRLKRFDLSLSSGQSHEMASLYRNVGAHDIGAFHLLRYRSRPPVLQRPKLWLRDLAAWMLPRLHRRPRTCHRQPLSAETAAEMVVASSPGTFGYRSGPIWGPWVLWRYAGPIHRDCNIWHLTIGGTTGGILVTRPEPGSERIVDLLAPEDCLPELLSAAAWTSEAPEITGLVAGGGLPIQLRRAGFLMRPQSGHVFCVTASAEPMDLDRIVLLAGISDTDLLRPPTSRGSSESSP